MLSVDFFVILGILCWIVLCKVFFAQSVSALTFEINFSNFLSLQTDSNLKKWKNAVLWSYCCCLQLWLRIVIKNLSWHQLNWSSHSGEQKQGDQMFLLKNRPKTMKNSPKSRPTMFMLDLLYKTVLGVFCLILC